jgi:hypothetical protein
LVQFHFTPTRASWLNQVEIWFSILQAKSLHGASFTWVKQLREHIDALFNDAGKGEWSVAEFTWEHGNGEQRNRIGIRWNGEGDELGTPPHRLRLVH